MATLEALFRTEKIIAFGRVLVATAALAVFVIDPKEPSFRPDLAYVVLSAYFAYSTLVFLLMRAKYLRQEWLGPYWVAADVAWVTGITMFTEGSTSPFFLLHVFVITSVSLRWGLTVTMAVALILAILYPLVYLFIQGGIAGGDLTLRRAHLFRPVYLLVLGYLIGYLGWHERRARRKLEFMLDLPAAFRRSRPPGRAITRLMRRALDHFDAQRALLVLRDPESGRYFTWDLVRRGSRKRLSLRITEDDPLQLPFVAATEAFLMNDVRPRTGAAHCYDVLSGVTRRQAVVTDLALPDRDAVQTLLAAPVLIQRELRGHAVIVREAHRKFTRDDLEFLMLLVAQAAAGFESVRLQEKAEELAVLEERARIARDLHDGFIQSLAGIDLRVAACKLLLDRDPGRVPRELEELHEVVDRGYRDVRRYLNMLRTGRPADDLWFALDHLAAEFSGRERLRVHLARPSTDPGLPPAAGHELAQIVREALRNAVRHGHATQAVIKINRRPSHLYLVVRDNGAGFRNGRGRVDADGFLALTAAPWSIRERTTALGGSLSIWTQPGRGAEIALVIPTALQADRLASDRRKSA